MNIAAETKNKTLEPLIALAILLWATAGYLLGYFNSFENSPPFLFGSCIIVIQVLLLGLYFFNEPFRQFSNSIPLSTIALLHVWRILAGWVFLANADKLPVAFVNNAAYGDLLAGILAVSVFIFKRTKIAYYVFNVIGLVDFVVAVGTGLTLSAFNLHSMEHLWQLPLILIPFFGVPISGLTHVISLVRLFKAKNKKWSDSID